MEHRVAARLRLKSACPVCSTHLTTIANGQLIQNKVDVRPLRICFKCILQDKRKHTLSHMSFQLVHSKTLGTYRA
jgi:transcriptional regulator NrdR family protein